MRLTRTPQFRRDLREILTYIAQDNPDAAEEVYDKIYASTALLLRQPGLGRQGRAAGTRELIVTAGGWRGGYIVPYRVRVGRNGDERVELLAIIHGARDRPDPDARDT